MPEPPGLCNIKRPKNRRGEMVWYRRSLGTMTIRVIIDLGGRCAVADLVAVLLLVVVGERR
jgi:hypothetical protein